MRSSLFLKIYLTLLASLAVVAMLSVVFVRMGQDEQDRGWGNRRDRFVNAMFPPNDDPASLRLVLTRLANALGADISVYDPEGRLIASTGAAPPDDSGVTRHRRSGSSSFRLADGRTVVAHTPMPFGPAGRNPIAYIMMIALVIGLVAYPVVRSLTRRLESLRRGVEIWGGGALDLRVPVSGSDEVAAVAKSFNLAADRIERLVVAHRTLLANASHELRSPLARLRMAIDLYERSPVERTKKEIQLNLAELDSLVEEILLASRLDHVQGLDHSGPVDLLALTAEEGARHDVSVSGVAATITGDPRLLKRLVGNLMQNAQRHGAPPVTAEIESDGSTVRLRVRDHGDGIPEEERSRIFDPFYRPKGHSESMGNWGLGLSLVRQIATHHAGAVRYEAVPGGGACFVVDFPSPRRE